MSGFAYDPSGNKVNVNLKNGVTTMQDGSRLPAGYTVQTAGGIFKMGDDGKGFKVDNHNTAPGVNPTETTNPQTESIVPTQESGGVQYIQEMFQNTSDAFYKSQVASADKILKEQLTNLQIAYNEAINNGQLSVNEAKEQFEAQKKTLEQEAYEQSKATKLYSNEMGIQHSPQMIGLQQGDNARFTSLRNDNVNSRDKRINEIRDRINLLTKEKDLKTAQAMSEYEYNLSGARAEADKMYSENVGKLMSEDYFTGRKEQHDFNVMDKNKEDAIEMKLLDWGFKKEELGIVQKHAQENAKYASDLRIDEMYVGHKLDLKKMDKELVNIFAKMDKQYGIDSKLLGQQHNNAMNEISAKVKTEAEIANNEYEEAMAREARRLGVTGEYDEYDIAQALKKEGRENVLWEITTKRDAAIQDSMVMGVTQYEIQQILNNPDLDLNPQYKQDFTTLYPGGNYNPLNSWLGGVNNVLFGVNKANAKADTAVDEKIAALDALRRYKANLGMDTSKEDAEINKLKFNKLSK